MTSRTVINNTYEHHLDRVDLIPYHGAIDLKKLQTLVDSMIASGWVGAPLVKFDDNLLTGSHRYRAARLSELATIPVVDYKDVFCVDADEIDEIVAESDDWVVKLSAEALESDPEIAKELGIDAH